MSYYTPTFSDRAQTQFEQLSPSLQEVALDAIEEMLNAVLPPAIARRLTSPLVEQHEATVSADGKTYYVFLSAELDPIHRKLRIRSVGVVRQPTP